jgi:hypothetical protein
VKAPAGRPLAGESRGGAGRPAFFFWCTLGDMGTFGLRFDRAAPAPLGSGLAAEQKSACVVTEPDGRQFLELPFVVPVFVRVLAGQVVQGLEVSVSGEYDFQVRVISAALLTGGPRVQVEWPDGRYLSTPGLPLFDFVGTGMRGRLLENPETIGRTEKILLNVDNS